MAKLTLRTMFCVFLLTTAGCGSAMQATEVPTDEQIDQTIPGGGGGDTTNGNNGQDLPPSQSSYSNPVNDRNFTKMPDGRDLSVISVSGSKLSLTKGTGTAFTDARKQEYMKLKSATQTDPDHNVQWVLMDLDSHKVLDKSLSSNRKLFGASSSKVYVAATLLDQQNGTLTSSQLQLMANMLVVSSNEAWTTLQSQIGGGNSDKGRQAIQAFTAKMGYAQTRGFQGYLGKVHGNELVPDEAVEMLYDIYTSAFPGAALQWKLMHTCRTGASRGLKYIPKTIYVGGKTGTYDGPTENPDTGKSYEVAVRNHLMVFNAGGREYGLAVLANSGSDESAALLAGGLIREYGGVQ